MAVLSPGMSSWTTNVERKPAWRRSCHRDSSSWGPSMNQILRLPGKETAS